MTLSHLQRLDEEPGGLLKTGEGLQPALCPLVWVLGSDGGSGLVRNAFMCLNISFDFSILIACPASLITANFASSPTCLCFPVINKTKSSKSHETKEFLEIPILIIC